MQYAIHEISVANGEINVRPIAKHWQIQPQPQRKFGTRAERSGDAADPARIPNRRTPQQVSD